jgi:EAL domain-containing protein (putative c-di-GMP-specific phosphodiesterase class I)/FixJ family two-component response regulator
MTSISSLGFLVVEDHEFQKWHCCSVLTQMGATRVLSAQDGNAALELLGQPGLPIDIVISDLNMPEMDGMALIRKIAESGVASSLIIVSSVGRAVLASTEAMAQAYGVRLLGAIEKPVTARKLAALLDRHEATPMAGAPPRSAKTFTAEEIAEGLRGDQFEAFYQPKVDVKTGETRGAEALVRWHHPVHGLVYPGDFIEAMEANGLLATLTWRVLRSAVDNCRIWREAGLDINVSVNITVSALEDVSFAERLVALVAEAGLSPRHLMLEITETAAARDLGRKLETLSRLRMRGFGLSIDDYGTGYSSMQRLSRVPFTELKIDQSFVRGAATQPSSRAMLESSILSAAKLGIPAVAEGVETKPELDMLLSLACPLAQGFYIAQPLEAKDFLDWVRARGRISA